MCGRYTLRTPTRDVVEAFGLANSLDLTPRYNIAPTQQVPAVWLDLESGTRQLSLFRWGLIPFWAKDSAIGNRMINARAESITSKPAFRDSFQKRRCLVVADECRERPKRSPTERTRSASTMKQFTTC